MATEQDAKRITIEQIIKSVNNALPGIQKHDSTLSMEHFTILIRGVQTAIYTGAERDDIWTICCQAAAEAEFLQKSTDYKRLGKWAEQLREIARHYEPKNGQATPPASRTPQIQDIMRIVQLSKVKTQLGTLTLDVKDIAKFLVDADEEKMYEFAGGLTQLLTPMMDNRDDIITETIQKFIYSLQRLTTSSDIIRQLKQQPGLDIFLEEEIKKPEYNGLDMNDIIEQSIDEQGTFIDGNLYQKALAAAIETQNKTRLILAQNEGRKERLQLKERAQQQGAIMELKSDSLPIFSASDLWDAFAPNRIAKIGRLNSDTIDNVTGIVQTYNLEEGDIVPLNAADISYKTFLLLNAIMASSVENFRQYFINDGSITFYVKGVLDKLEIDPRIRNDEQLNINRKTAGVLYLESLFEPLLSFIGTIPGGSRYSVLNYEGYNADTDAMTIRSPYLFRLWNDTQQSYHERKQAKENSIANNKKPSRHDLRPLEVNTLFKQISYKEDDAVLEIATYITNILLQAGAGAHRTEIDFKTIIKYCSRLRERLEEIDSLPKTELLPNGKQRNNTARYNTELRKIARAYSIIMDCEKCDAQKYFKFIEFTPTKEVNGKMELIAPTKSTLDGKIIIRWRKIPQNDD